MVRIDDLRHGTRATTAAGVLSWRMPWRLPDFTSYLRDERNLSPHTLRAYEREIAGFVEFARGEMRLARPREVTPATVRAYLAELHSRRLARVSVQRALAALRTYMRFLGREGVVEANPARVVPTPRAPKPLPEVVGATDVAELLDALPATSAGRRDRAALELLYAAGLRVSELVGLDLDDVDLSRRLARVIGKGNKERVVPFGKKAEAAIRCYLPDRAAWRHQGKVSDGEEPLLVNQRGGRLSDRSLRRILDAAVHHCRARSQAPPARAAPRLRHPPARGGDGPARDPGAARPHLAVHHAALHPPRPRPPDGDVPQGPPQGVRKAAGGRRELEEARDEKG